MDESGKLGRIARKLTLLTLAVLLLGLLPYPRAYTAALRRAEAHRAVGAYTAALEAYREAAGLDAAAPRPWLRLGEMLLDWHRFAEAGAAFDEAERRGGGVEALLGRGESLAGRGDWAAAIGAWLRAQALAQDEDEVLQARVLLALGRGSIAQGHFAQAQRYLSQVLALEPATASPASGDVAAAHSLLGRLLVGDDPETAAAHFRLGGDTDMLAVLDAASAETDAARQVLLLGAAFLQRDELSLARRALERAVAASASASAEAGAEARAYLAHTLDRLGETAAAGELLAQALALDPESALAYYFLGVHHRLVGNTGRAQEALWEALLRDPENAALRVEMAEAFLDAGDYPHAEEWYVGAVAVAPEEVEFQLLLVRFYVDHLYHVEEGGLPAAQAAVALAPGDARTHDLLGWAYHLAGQHVAGLQALLQALALDPALASAHYHLGALYANTGRPQPAREHLQRAIDLDTGGYYRRRAEALLLDLE